MTTALNRNKDLADVDFDDIDDLLNKLTPEELEELNNDVDPDDSYLPASQRCRDQTKKDPTGPYKRDKLLKFLEDQGRAEKDWEQNKAYVKEVRGKVWQAPPPPQPGVENQQGDMETVSTEWDEILTDASEAEIVELAAILGFTGLVNQVQFHAAEKMSKGDPNEKTRGEETVSFGGWNAAAKAELLKFVPPEPDNQTDVDASIKQLQDNDTSLTTLNLNNIKNISYEKMNQIVHAMKSNTSVKILTMANIDMPDSVATNVAQMLEENDALLTLNIESNLLTGQLVADIVRATLKNQSLIDLRLSNQRAQILGNRVEQDIAETVSDNSTLLRLGVHFNTLGPRARVQDKLKKNWDKLRLKRVGANRDNADE